MKAEKRDLNETNKYLQSALVNPDLYNPDEPDFLIIL